MGEPKPGWKRYRFGDMVASMGATRKARGWTAGESGVDRYVGLEHLDSNSLKIRRWGSPDDVGANSDLRHFEPGDVILARRGIELRKVGVAEFRGVASGHALVFRAKPEVVLPELLPFFMQSDAFMMRADRFSVGSLSHTVNLSALTREEFALPPLEEQQRLVLLLGASEGVQRAHADAVTVANAVVCALRDDHFSKVKREQWCPMADATYSATYGPRFPGSDYSEYGNVRTIRTTDMPDHGVITLDTAPAANVPLSMANQHAIKAGDFLISRTGFTSGRAAVVENLPTDGPTYIPAAFLIRARLRTTTLLPHYLLAFIGSSAGTALVRRLQRGTQQLNISASSMLAQDVPMPPISAQHAALDHLNAAAVGLRVARERLAQAKRLLATLISSTMQPGGAQ